MMLFLAIFFWFFWGRGHATLHLFLYVTEEAGRKYVLDMPWLLHGRTQYDYKQTNKQTNLDTKSS